MIVLAIIHLLVLLIMLFLSYKISIKGKDKWKSFFLIPGFIIIIIANLLFFFNMDMQSIVNWIIHQTEIILSWRPISHDFVIIVIFLIAALLFLCYKLLFRILIRLLKKDHPSLLIKFGEFNDQKEFEIDPQYYFYGFLFRSVMITILLFIVIYSFVKFDVLIFIADLFLLFVFELVLLFPRVSFSKEIPKFNLDCSSSEDDEPLKNNQQFEKFYHMVREEKKLKDEILLAIQKKIRVVRDTDNNN